MDEVLFPAIWLAFFALCVALSLWAYVHPFEYMRAIIRPMKWFLPAPPFQIGRVQYLWTHETEVLEDTPEALDWFRTRRTMRTMALILALVAFGMLMTFPFSVVIHLLT